jgi:hypothetical protein
MKKTRANVEEIVLNVLSLEMPDSGLLTPERVSQIVTHYLQTNEVLLPDAVLGAVVTYENDSIPPGVEALRLALYQEFERYTPSEKKAFEDAAKVIIVKVLGLDLEFETYLDANGTQRFKTDTVVVNLFDQNMIDLDSLSRAFRNGKISTEDFLTFYAKSGYSVGGLASLSHFSHLTFENPLW